MGRKFKWLNLFFVRIPQCLSSVRILLYDCCSVMTCWNTCTHRYGHQWCMAAFNPLTLRKSRNLGEGLEDATSRAWIRKFTLWKPLSPSCLCQSKKSYNPTFQQETPWQGHRSIICLISSKQIDSLIDLIKPNPTCVLEFWYAFCLA